MSSTTTHMFLPLAIRVHGEDCDPECAFFQAGSRLLGNARCRGTDEELSTPGFGGTRRSRWCMDNAFAQKVER